MPATLESYRMLDAAAIGRMRDGVFLVNLARHSLVDTTAIIQVIESGKLVGAALDMLVDEAILYNNDLRGSPP
jgi:D-lactate dehydrogenase